MNRPRLIDNVPVRSLAFGVAVFSLMGISLGSDRARLGLSDIRAHVERNHNAVVSLAVIYVRARPVKVPNDPIRSDRFRFLVKGRLRCRETRHSTTRLPESADLNHITQFLTHDSFNYYIHNARYYEASHKSVHSNAVWKLKDDEYLELCGWWPSDDEPSSAADARIAAHLRFALKNPHYSLEDHMEPVDGRPCYVVQHPGVDRLWLDPAVGFAIRRREFYDEGGMTVLRRSATDFQEYDVIDPAGQRRAIWLPTRLAVEYRSDETPGDGSVPMAKEDFRVEKLSLNDVQDSDFLFTPPPGTLVYDRDNNTSRQIPGGRDLLDENIAIVQMRRRVSKKSASAEPAVHRDIYVPALAVGALLLANAVAFFRATLRRRLE